MVTRFTPGPWRVGRALKYGTFHRDQIVAEQQDRSVAQVYGLPCNDSTSLLTEDYYVEPLANAALIAAAPDMFNILRRICDEEDRAVSPRDIMVQTLLIDEAKAILARARGAE